MADFRTHVAVASTVSGVIAIGGMVAGVATPKEVVLFFCAGTIGGVLPDIDSDHTIPVQILFSFLSVALAFMSVFSKADTYSVVELACLWILVHLFVRHVLYKIFAKFTVHRGIFHSQLAAVFFLFFERRGRISPVWPRYGHGLARRLLCGAWLHDPSAARRDLQRRSHRREGQEVVWHRAQVCERRRAQDQRGPGHRHGGLFFLGSAGSE